MTMPEQFKLLPQFGKWLVLALLVAVLAGMASALFLHLLDWATQTREAHRWLLALLPVAGLVVAWVYLRIGQSVEGGNNLLIDQIHDPSQTVPLRMAPLILFSTVISHLFGASVGREGTAVQMGGALADQVTRLFKLTHADRRILLMAGISAGFSSVFGTPLAGAVFGLEVLVIGRMRYDALWPCFVAAIVANQVTMLLGIEHAHYTAGAVPALSIWPIAAVLLAGAIFGLMGMVFSESTHALSAFMKRHIAYSPWRPALGGAVMAPLVWLTDGWRYVGLGMPTIEQAFVHTLPWWDFAGKLLFTAGAIGTGFKGGEVTPLFFIGATLGNALAPLLHLPIGMLSALGFVAVFAGAANTPLACTLMALELFGSQIGVYAALACVVSYLFSGHTGIYRSQRIGQGKHQAVAEDIKLSDAAAFRHDTADR